MAQLNVSVSTTRGTSGSMTTIAKLAISFLRFLKASVAANERGKLFVRSKEHAFHEKEAIN